MTPVEELREAARLMRERAEQCGSFRGPWRFERTDNKWPTVGRISTADDDPHGLIASLWPSAECGEYMASMHPAVALAVADWLEDEAVRIDDVPYRVDSDWIERNYRAPLTVARAYLGDHRADG